MLTEVLSLRFSTRRLAFVAALLATLCLAAPGAWAQDHAPEHSPESAPNAYIEEHAGGEGTGLDQLSEGAAAGEHADGEHGADGEHAATGEHGADGEHAAAGEHGEAAAAPSVFAPHQGTFLNWLTRLVFGLGPVEKHEIAGQEHYTNIDRDYIVVTLLAMALLGGLGVMAAKQSKVRPEGKPTSLAHIFEAMLDAWQDYTIGIMGENLGRKYTPLIASFFFTILLFNMMGLVPGLLAPTANPNIPIALAIVAFFATHVIAIREAGLKAWFLHLVGEPRWLAPLNFPLHLIGEIVKPVSLAIRLLCNMFGKEMVILNLALMAVAATAVTKIPIPFHLPILLLGVFIAFLQALVFSTLLAIYIAILATHHDEHDEHGHTEHIHEPGPDRFVGHPAETPVA